MVRVIVAFIAFLGVTSPSAASAAQVVSSRPRLTEQRSGTSVLLQAVSPLDRDTVWVSGHGGTFVRTTDGGDTWSAGVVPGADSLQFRDVHAVNGTTAYLLSAGPGDRSRIYKTTDAGTTWDLQFTNKDPDAFFDCLDFWTPDHGLAFSDAVDGEFVIMETTDGRTWTRVDPTRVPDAQSGEGGFAASGTCLVTGRDGHVWIGTGAASRARVLRTEDRGRTWSAVMTPMVSGSGTSGITSLAFRDMRHGIAVGGEIADPEGRTDNVAVTADGGASWVRAGRPQITGAFYGAAYVPEAPTPTVIAVGPRGADLSRDNGATWTNLSRDNYWAVGFGDGREGWAVGPGGRITKIRFQM